MADLLRFTQREPDDQFQLDNDVWNTHSFCRLLEETFPKDGTKVSRGVDDFHILVKNVNLNYHYDDVSAEIGTLRSIRFLVTNYGESRISARDEELAVGTWIKMWSKATQDNFKAFVGSDSLKKIDEFTTKLQRWTARGRKAGAEAALAGYVVSASKLTSFYGGGKSEHTSHSHGGGKSEHLPFTPKNVGGAKRDIIYGPGSSSGSGSGSERPTKKVNLQDDNAKYTGKGNSNHREVLCNHCGRVKHDGPCPFIELLIALGVRSTRPL